MSVVDNTKPIQPRSTLLALTFQRPAGTHEAYLVLTCSIFSWKGEEASFWLHMSFVHAHAKVDIAPLWNVLHEKSKYVHVPASNVVDLEHTSHTISHSLLCAKTEVQISYKYRPMFYIGNKLREN